MNNKIFVTNVRVLRFLYKYEFFFYNKIKMERFRHSILSLYLRNCFKFYLSKVMKS